MSIARPVVRWLGTRAARRVAVSVPFAGAAVALMIAGAAIRRKGVVGGILDTALNATPVLGLIKNTVEMLRGDLIPDRDATRGRK